MAQDRDGNGAREERYRFDDGPRAVHSLCSIGFRFRVFIGGPHTRIRHPGPARRTRWLTCHAALSQTSTNILFLLPANTPHASIGQVLCMASEFRRTRRFTGRYSTILQQVLKHLLLKLGKSGEG